MFSLSMIPRRYTQFFRRAYNAHGAAIVGVVFTCYCYIASSSYLPFGHPVALQWAVTPTYGFNYRCTHAQSVRTPYLSDGCLVSCG